MGSLLFSFKIALLPAAASMSLWKFPLNSTEAVLQHSKTSATVIKPAHGFGSGCILLSKVNIEGETGWVESQQYCWNYCNEDPSNWPEEYLHTALNTIDTAWTIKSPSILMKYFRCMHLKTLTTAILAC